MLLPEVNEVSRQDQLMQQFELLLEESVNLLQPFPTRPVLLPPEYAYVRVEQPQQQGVLCLSNRFVEITGYGELRSVLFSGPEATVVTMFFFPSAELQLPVFAMELAVLAAHPVVAVIDGKCLFRHMRCAARVETVFRDARRHFADLAQADDVCWQAGDCRFESGLFLKPAAIGDMWRLVQAHLFVWRELKELLHAPAYFDEIGSHLHRLQLKHYKTQYRRFSPSLRLVNNSLGETWTQHYLAHCLFG
jgi:hypothetical protein